MKFLQVVREKHEWINLEMEFLERVGIKFVNRFKREIITVVSSQNNG